MAIINWITDQPSQDTTASEVDNTIRISLATIAVGLGGAMYWPGSAATAGSAGSAGEFLLGAARLSETTVESGVDSVASNGFLSMKTAPAFNYASLRHIGSSGSFLIGHPIAPEHNDEPELLAPFESRWVQRSGTEALSGVALVSDHNINLGVTYGGNPAVTITSSNNSVIAGVTVLAGASNFSSRISYVGPGAPVDISVNLDWVSLGTVSF